MHHKSNTEEFIQKSKKIHGDKYDYSLVKYERSNINVKIICKIHGPFDQLPNNHLRKYGCYKCSGKFKLDNETFALKANLIHNNFYNYSKVKYINNEIKIEIECPIHGIFKQQPNNHLNGLGCKKCGGNHIPSNEEFILKANEIHNNLYNYSKVNYINTKTEIDIICKIHGEFKQLPVKHLAGHGCRICGGSIRLTTSEFIKRANEVHNNLYKYDKANYINNRTNVKIECFIHGIFNQQPGNHLDGKGCKKCNQSRGEIKIENILKESNVIYKSQYYFKDLKHISYLKFDFAIFDESENLKYLIEFNGQQHYEYVEFIHKSYECFEISKLRDQLKIDYCIKNKIKLITIKYNEDIDFTLMSLI